MYCLYSIERGSCGSCYDIVPFHPSIYGRRTIRVRVGLGVLGFRAQSLGFRVQSLQATAQGGGCKV